MRKEIANSYFNLAIVLLAVLIYFTVPYQISDMQISYISSRAFPLLLSLTLFIVSAANLTYELFFSKRSKESNFTFISKQTLFIYFIMTVCVIAIPYFGFTISVITGASCILLLLKVKKPYAYVIIPLITYFIAIVFTEILYIDLPEGSLL